MYILLASGRHAAPDDRCSRDASFAAALAASGCEVTWIRPQSAPDDLPDLPDLPDFPEVSGVSGVRIVPVVSAVPGFRAVQGRLLDGPVECVVMQLVRARVPDVVHLLAYGASTSVNITWAANRLGARSVVSVDSLATVCHRGDLRYQGREVCTDWRDAARCARCCLSSAPGGLTLLQSLLGRGLATLRSPLNPYPAEFDFLSRMDLLIGGLQSADRVVVETDEAKRRLVSLGLREDMFDVLSPSVGESPSVQPWLELYRRVAANDDRSFHAV